MEENPPPSLPLIQYAGFWWRFLACLIDLIILALPFALLLMAGDPGLGCIILAWLYYALCENSAWQGTPGKRLCHLIVMDTEDNALSFGRATGRFFAKFISMATLGAGFVIAAFSDQRQALHDLIAETLVVRMK